MNYTKQPLDYADIICMLKSRGLVIGNEDKALECLKRVSYFRLANYFHPMEKDKVNHIFKPNSEFDNAIDLYDFDRDLRLLLFSAVQSLEIGLRTKMIHHISLKYGAFWFTDSSHFQNQDIFQNCLKQVKQEISRTKEDFIVGHFAKYGLSRKSVGINRGNRRRRRRMCVTACDRRELAASRHQKLSSSKRANRS